jgi:diguanylate cyclase (GGDEF)-like protein/PAS domain S-box-containing protein
LIPKVLRIGLTCYDNRPNDEDASALKFHRLIFVLTLAFVCLVTLRSAFAVDVVRVPPDAAAINLLPFIDPHRSAGDEILISTAPGADGIVRRIAVKAKTEGSQSDWMVFALKNDSSDPLVRWVVAPHQHLVGSGIIWPDLGATRIVNLTSSQGTSPERQASSEADIFQISLDPGAAVTFVAELASPNLPELTLWTPDAYKDKANGLTFYHGIITGIIGLLALFLTILSLIRGTIIFPSAALLAWAVVAYVAVDFGFMAAVFATTPEGERLYRAIAESVLASTLFVFLFAYLDLKQWRIRYHHITTVWLLFFGGLVAIALIDPAVASGLARISMAVVTASGFLLIVYLATHGYDRAILLVPTWLVLLGWTTAAGFTLIGQVTSDLAAQSLIGGLVLIILLIGFTVMQHAFTGGGLAGAELTDASRKALALTGAGDIIFDWDVTRDQVRIGPEAEAILGYSKGHLAGMPSDFIDHLHPADRDLFTAAIDRFCQQRRGRLSLDVRLKANDGHFHWFRMRARPIIGEEGVVLRLMGTLSDVTDTRLTEERLLHDAIHDTLTGLPNRRLLIDRIDLVLALMREGETLRPTVVAVDLDRFREANEALGLSSGDALLLAVTRRLLRLLRPQDGLARIGGDRFAILLLSEREPGPITALVDQIRKGLATPITVGEKEANLTVSIGIALPDQRSETNAELLLRNAEIAMTHAKKLGGDRIDVFRPAMRAQGSERLALEIDLRDAIKRRQIELHFRPVIRLTDRSISGFEVIPVWNHPQHGAISQSVFMEIAENAELVGSLGQHILEATVNELALWHKLIDIDPPFFATLPIPTQMLERPEFVRDVKAILSRSTIAKSSLHVELSERYLMDHPEHAMHNLNGLIDLGTGLAVGEFGQGYSSLGYLERFPFHTIRLSRTITRPDPSGIRPAILRSIVTLANEMDIDLVADGLETESDIIQFSQLGLPLGQGSVFGPALNSADTRKLIKG